MTALEVVVVVGGLGLGYWAVSNLMSAPPRNGNRKPGHDSQQQQNDASNDHWWTPDDGGPRAEAATDADIRDTWFKTLGVVETAPLDTITQAYKHLIRQYHPDKVANLGPEFRTLAETHSRQINTAYAYARKLRRGKA